MKSNGLAPIHPGEHLAEMLEELQFSQAALARTIGVSPMRISHVIKGTVRLLLNSHCCSKSL